MKQSGSKDATLNNDVRAVAIVANMEKPQAKEELARLRVWLKRRKITPLSFSQLSDADAVITLGGDGTILLVAPEAARLGIPVLGVNIGRLGFMTAVEAGRMYEALESWLSGEWTISHRMMLEASLSRFKNSFFALNDVVIRTGDTMRVISLFASIEDQDLGCFTGDGVIVATPTGSTAYSLAAQGPVVHPEVEVLIFTPICAHSFTQRPVVFPARQTLELSLHESEKKGSVQLSLDGQHSFPLKGGDRIQVHRAPFELKLFQNPHVSYFTVLREKLSWGERG